jgi:hypothetical protein
MRRVRLNVHRAVALAAPLAVLGLIGAPSTPAFAKGRTQLMRFSTNGTIISDYSGDSVFPADYNTPAAYRARLCPAPAPDQSGKDQVSGKAHVFFSGSARGRGRMNNWIGTGGFKLNSTADGSLVCRYYDSFDTLVKTVTITAHTVIHWTVARGVRFRYSTVPWRNLEILGHLSRAHLKYSMTKVQDGVTSHLPFLFQYLDNQARMDAEFGPARPGSWSFVYLAFDPTCWGDASIGLHPVMTIGGRRWPRR